MRRSQQRTRQISHWQPVPAPRLQRAPGSQAAGWSGARRACQLLPRPRAGGAPSRAERPFGSPASPSPRWPLPWQPRQPLPNVPAERGGRPGTPARGGMLGGAAPGAGIWAGRPVNHQRRFCSVALLWEHGSVAGINLSEFPVGWPRGY